MKSHVHFDVVQAAWTVAVVVVGLHFMRGAGAYLSAHGMQTVGNTIGGLATFNS